MHSMKATYPELIEVQWKGPYRWPGFPSIGDANSFNKIDTSLNSGIYLWTVEYLNGFLIYAAGITRRPFIKRFREHTRSYRTGIYTIFNMPLLKQGVRKKIWHGFWYKKNTDEKQHEYNSNRDEITLAVEEQLSNFRVFVASVDPSHRILERLEASIMNALYDANEPISTIPDRGMMLAPRLCEENPILVLNNSSAQLYGIPKKLMI